jgi:hypothetical protein
LVRRALAWGYFLAATKLVYTNGWSAHPERFEGRVFVWAWSSTWNGLASHPSITYRNP